MDEAAGRIVVDGRAVCWRRLGSADAELGPLLLLNGYAATAADWDPGFLEALAARFDLICPDPCGAGGSALREGTLTVERMAADAAAVLDDLGLDSASVAGWSMGGFVAQQLAATAPGRVRALALLATDPGGEAQLAEPADWAALTDHSGTPDEQARRMLGLLFPAAFAQSVYEQFGEIVAEARSNLDPRALSAQESAMDAWHSAPGSARLREISAPAAVVAGAEDRVIPSSNAELLAAELGVEAELLAGCGHAFMAQQPERAAELVIELAASR